jgi:hypothetical protein
MYVVTAQTLEEGDAKLVEVRAGATTEVALESQGSGTLEGTVVEHGKGTPLAGFICHTTKRAGPYEGITNWSAELAPKTDAQGKFVLSPAPAGDVHVSCMKFPDFAEAQAAATVPRGGRAAVTLTAVRRAESTRSSVGIDFSHTSVEPRIVRVLPAGPAARAGLAVGDLVVTVGGVDVSALGASAVDALIRNHPVGSKVTLGVKRGAQVKTVTLEVVVEDR